MVPPGLTLLNRYTSGDSTSGKQVFGAFPFCRGGTAPWDGCTGYMSKSGMQGIAQPAVVEHLIALFVEVHDSQVPP